MENRYFELKTNNTEMGLNLDYLDVLYDWKVKADIELEKYKIYVMLYIYNKEDAKQQKREHEMRLKTLQEKANRCKIAIRVYIAHHT
jgi:hypothetical protein